MNKDIFDGFNDIKADDILISQTRKKMHNQKSCKNFSMRKVSIAAIPIIAALLVFLIVFLNLPAGNSFMTASAQDLMNGITPQKVNTEGALNDKFIKSTQNFSMNLFKSSVKDGENSLVSPSSIFLALGMTANGADKDTLSAFKKVLGKYNSSLDELNKGYKAYSDYILEKHGHTQLNIANSIWYRKEFNPLKSFLQTNANYYNSGALSLDFNDKSSIDVINNWVKQHTENKIDKMVYKIDDEDVMFLINAVYFNGKWQTAFNAADNHIAPFHLENGKTENVTFMNLTQKLDYFKNNNASGVMLPYDDGRFALLCILPNENTKMNDYIKSLNDNSISELVKNMKHDEISISMPKFKTSFSTELKDALTNMGLGIAFEDTKADFSKMGSKGLYISSVTHKTFFEIDESGTKASASTKVEIRQLSLPEKSLCFNRPFIYSIIDTKTNIPLFIGTMENPNQQ